MSLQKRHILMTSFFASQFKYWPSIWMCHSRSLNDKVNHIHERTLRIVYQDFQSSFSALLKDNSFTIRQKNLQSLVIETFKVKMDISPEIMNEIFYFSKNFAYELRNGNCLSRSNIHSTHFRIESIANIATKIWNKIPKEIKEACSLTVFKSEINKWFKGCLCRLCKTKSDMWDKWVFM